MESLLHIECTKEYAHLKERETRKTFIRAFNEAFPLKIEEQYVTLTNYIGDYFATCNTLAKYDEELYLQILYLQEFYYQLESSKELETIQVQLSTMINRISENNTPDAYREISEMANTARKALEKRNRANQKIKVYNEARYQYEGKIAVEREELKKIVARISNTLQAIAALNIAGERRIDGLQISQKHLSDMDNLAITPLEKDTLKKEFISYFNMRCIAFRYIEELAEKIVEAYSKREVFYSTYKYVEQDEALEMYMIALKMLRVFPNDNHSVGNVHSSDCDRINADCEMIDIITGFLKDGTVNEEDYFRARELPEHDPHIESLATDTMFAIKRIRSESFPTLR